MLEYLVWGSNVYNYLKLIRLKTAILGLKFVNLVMFNCSLLSKTWLNFYRPTCPIFSVPTFFSNLTISEVLFKNDANEKRRLMAQNRA